MSKEITLHKKNRVHDPLQRRTAGQDLTHQTGDLSEGLDGDFQLPGSNELDSPGFLLKRTKLLQAQQLQGNQYVNRVLQRQPVHSRSINRKRRAGAHLQVEGTTAAKSPNIATLIAVQFPHLAKVLTADQISQFQKSVDADRQQQELKKKRSKLLHGNEEGYIILSEDAHNVAAIDRKLQELYEIFNNGLRISVPTKLLLDRDVLESKEKDSPKLNSFRESIYVKLLTYPINLMLDIGAVQSPGVMPILKLFWGPHNWQLSSDGGLIHFSDLMRVDDWNLAYQAVLLGEEISTLSQMSEIAREFGGKLYDVEGKKLGEIYGTLWNDNVKVGSEAGRLGGYHDDTRGRGELYSAVLRMKSARVVLRAPDGWLHLYGISPSIVRDTLKSPRDDGYVYLLDKGREVGDVLEITTRDGYTLEKSPLGWRCTADPSAPGNFEKFAMGAIFGDAYEDPSVAATIGQILIGVIPIVGQIADTRDVAVGIHKIWITGGKEGKFQTMMALVSLVPVIGDLLRRGSKSATKASAESVKEALETASPAIQQRLAKAITEDSDEVAQAFGLSRAELKQTKAYFGELTEKTLKEGGNTSVKYSKIMLENYNTLGKNPAALVAMSGGEWSKVTKAISAGSTDEGKQLLKEMQEWRLGQVDILEKELQKEGAEISKRIGREAEMPKMVRTGTNSPLSDVDLSFLGRLSNVHRNAAISRMEQKYGSNWRKLLDMDIFSDPRRISLFEEVGGRVGKEIEKRLLNESKLNLLAKMTRDIEDQVVELGKKARDPTANFAQIAIEKEALFKKAGEVKDLARDLGVDMTKVSARRKELAALAPGSELRHQAELEMDALHARYNEATDLSEKAALAEKMGENQGKLNAALAEGPYITPGSVGRHVTRAERLMGIPSSLSPSMGYSCILGDLAMIKHTQLSKLSPSSAKSLMKYANRLLITAGNYGVDFSRVSKARELFNQVSDLLEIARKDPRRLLDEGRSCFDEASRLLNEQLGEMISAVEKNANLYLKEGVAVEAKSVQKIVEKSKKALQEQIEYLSIGSILARQYWMKLEQERKQSGEGH